MPGKPPSPKFAEIIPTGIIAIICGIGAISVLFQYPIIAFLVSGIGIVVGITTLKMNVERLDKIFAVIGIILSVGSMIYTIAVFIQ